MCDSAGPQVLVSIHALIFVPDPYFNEPGYEVRKGTAAGDLATMEYNQRIRTYTAKVCCASVVGSRPSLSPEKADPPLPGERQGGETERIATTRMLFVGQGSILIVLKWVRRGVSSLLQDTIPDVVSAVVAFFFGTKML